MKAIAISILAVILLIGGTILLTRSSPNSQSGTNANNVQIVDGKQVIEVQAKGGYFPRKSLAKADIPTVLRFDTNGTFDCSAAVRVPSLNLSKNLPATGTTDLDIGSPKAGVFQVICGMGMYRFEVEFQS